MVGHIYLLHFARPVGNLANPRGQASHYLGWALDPAAREQQHRSGRGAALTRAAAEQGIGWQLFVLGEGTRDLERRLKAKKATPRLCPICGRSHPGGRLHLPPPTWGQLPLLDDDDDEWAALVARPLPPMDFAEIQALRRAHTYTGDNLAAQDTSDWLIPF